MLLCIVWFIFLLYGVIYFFILGFYCMMLILVRVLIWEGMYIWGWLIWCIIWMSVSFGFLYFYYGLGCGIGSYVMLIRIDWNGLSFLMWIVLVNMCLWLNWGIILKVSYIFGIVLKVSYNFGIVLKVIYYFVIVLKVGLCFNWRIVYLRWVNRL